jgi:ABC-type nitrate/sulfonate/bicarbonate transport system substrate-binding protein
VKGRWVVVLGITWSLVAVLFVISSVQSGPSSERITVLSTVTRVVNLPALVGFKLLRQDGIEFTVRDLRTSEAAVLGTVQGQGEFGFGFAPFYAAIERGAPIRALFELSRPEFVVVAKREVSSVSGLHNLQLASHSPESTVQALLEFFLRDYPGVTPNVVFMPQGSPARAEALLRGAVDAAAIDLTSAHIVIDRAPGRFHILIDFTDMSVSSSFLIARQDYVARREKVVIRVIRRLLESYRRGLADPAFWAREGREFFPDLGVERLERELRALAKIYDPNGGIDRMTGRGAIANIEFQVAVGNIAGPTLKWRPSQFFDPRPLEAVLRELGRR